MARQLFLRFVDICKLAVIAFKRRRTFCKSFFLHDDSGVKEKLDGLDAVMDREQRLLASYNYKMAKTNQQSLDLANDGILTLKEQVSKIRQSNYLTGQRIDYACQTASVIKNGMLSVQRSNEALEGKLDITADRTAIIDESLAELRKDRELSKVRKKLRIPPKEVYERPWKELLAKRVENTGLWILETPAFKSWSDRCSKVLLRHILGVCGKKGHGESYLMASVVNSLRKGTRVEVPPHMSVAFFFFEKKSNDTT